MKIVYISNSIIPSRTANSIHVMKMCQAFSNNGHNVVLLAPHREKDYEKNIQDIFDYYGVDTCFEINRIPYLHIRIIGPVYYSLKIQKYIRKISPHIVYSRDLPGSLFATRNGFRTIYEAHGPLFKEKIFYKIIINQLFKSKNFQKLVVISQALKDIFSTNGYLTNKKIQIAHDGADEINNFEPLQEWPGRKGKLQVGYFGHLYEGRGMDIINEIAKRMPHVDFHVIGGNEKDIDFWKNKFKGINMTFHGYVPPKIVYKYRNTCDILLIPYQKKVALASSKSDTSSFMSPLKVFEYMSSQKTIISSDLPVLREILNEKNSILVNCKNVSEWINAIEKLHDKKIRNKLSRNAYNDFIKKYTWKQRASEVLNS